MAHLSLADRTAYFASLSPGDAVDHRGTTFDSALLACLLGAVRDPLPGGEPRLGPARFGRAIFTGDAAFAETTFTGRAEFDGATFVDVAMLGPLVCGGTLELSGAVFRSPVIINAAVAQVRCHRTRWEQTATLRLRYAEVDMADAVVTQPIAVSAHPTPVAAPHLENRVFQRSDPGVRIDSLRGVDAAHLVLADVDLTACRFAGAFHLDQLRLEGVTVFASTPAGMRRWRFARRRVLAEEHHWRARRQRDLVRTAGWTTRFPYRPRPVRGWSQRARNANARTAQATYLRVNPVPGPTALAPVYRALRKAFEDARNEPDAADFYYGEMEMRRLDRNRPIGERALIAAYWLLSGYGLRASRALGWLLLAMAGTVGAMMLWGLPGHDPEPVTTGTQAAPGEPVRLTTVDPGPEPAGPYRDRLTADRAESAARIVLNSVVFRSSGQNLTTTGTYIEMASRFAEPILLGLTALAIRGRVKR
ncbi:pentapeptide repeat-containing protein [Streptomyces sp. DSM 44917]|uniref:Pentapeptide repeat-containing protein n=1 Tax=Streptomyces boetiae TaxID=3075541 RepID=A0ABU2LEC2_9ACTN|nr:pentapeptide repeat-containing protein [Streptomyces sp. DSM 44917]MDT0309947.1 pentapeptide repeat-containing protein [Streptomyces sp. DSM 44917]